MTLVRRLSLARLRRVGLVAVLGATACSDASGDARPDDEPATTTGLTDASTGRDVGPSGGPAETDTTPAPARGDQHPDRERPTPERDEPAPDLGNGPGIAPDPGPAFEDVTESLGLHAPHQVVLGHFGAGLAWGDVDADGWLDLYVTGGEGSGTIFVNEGDGTFSLSPLTAAVASIPASTGATFVDFDNDGDADLYVVCRGPNVLLRNDGGEALVDVSAASGLDDPGYGATASWADWDADGDLDVFIANTGLQPDALYENLGKGLFADVSHLLVDSGSFQTFAGVFSDVDDDGDPDLYVAIDKHAGNQLWRNDGPGCGGWCFTEVAGLVGAAVEMDAMGIAVGDYDNDGDFDFAVSDHGGQVLVRNDMSETETFTVKVNGEAGLGLATTQPSWGIAALDYDGDGWLDLYAGASGYLGELVGNPLYRNLGEGEFVDVSHASGADDLGQTFGVASADFDHDGALDLAIVNRDDGLRLLHNRRTPSAKPHFVILELEGSGVGGRDAAGARVWLETSGGRTLAREVSIGSSLGAGGSTRLHLSLGAESAVGLTVRWPDGTTEWFASVPEIGVWHLLHPALRSSR